MAVALLALSISLCGWSARAQAHVKWFAEFDLDASPRSPAQIILGEHFIVFCVLTTALIFTIAYADRILATRRGPVYRGAVALTAVTHRHFSTALRLGVSAFFCAAAIYATRTEVAFILTPELAAQSTWLPGVHLAMSALAVLPCTAFLTGFGIVGLYAYAIAEFGLFHLLDYPIFLGVAACLITDSLRRGNGRNVAHDILRWCTGITLLWASIEKFAYPEWSFVLLAERPEISFGLDAEFYMVAAGFVEFCAAYLLITGMLSARAAAAVLLFFFISAIYYFGAVDAIGHCVIIVVLVLLCLSPNPLAVRMYIGAPARTALAHACAFLVALLTFVAAYRACHALLG